MDLVHFSRVLQQHPCWFFLLKTSYGNCSDGSYPGWSCPELKRFGWELLGVGEFRLGVVRMGGVQWELSWREFLAYILKASFPNTNKKSCSERLTKNNRFLWACIIHMFGTRTNLLNIIHAIAGRSFCTINDTFQRVIGILVNWHMSTVYFYMGSSRYPRQNTRWNMSIY